MPKQAYTAVAAIAVRSVRMQLLRVLPAGNVILETMTGNASSALEALFSHRPDLLITDMELPQLDGSALAMRALYSRSLPVRPKVILLHDPRFLLPAASVLEKCGVLLLKKPITEAAFQNAVQELNARPPFFPPEDVQRTEVLMDDLGLPDHPGRHFLKLAALVCAADERYLHSMGSRLYPEIGRLCGRSADQAERAMRHAIGLAWQSSQFENQYRIFADTVDARRGQPTCGEMISRLADILRLEG